MTSLAIMLANSRRNNFEKNLKKFEPFFGKSSMLANRRKPSLNLTRFQVPGGKVSPICILIDLNPNLYVQRQLDLKMQCEKQCEDLKMQCEKQCEKQCEGLKMQCEDLKKQCEDLKKQCV